jgi:hypothetical protein
VPSSPPFIQVKAAGVDPEDHEIGSSQPGAALLGQGHDRRCGRGSTGCRVQPTRAMPAATMPPLEQPDREADSVRAN